jgi:hypothetical protein
MEISLTQKSLYLYSDPLYALGLGAMAFIKGKQAKKS